MTLTSIYPCIGVGDFGGVDKKIQQPTNNNPTEDCRDLRQI